MRGYNPSNIHPDIRRVDATEKAPATKPLGRNKSGKPAQMKAMGTMKNVVRPKKIK